MELIFGICSSALVEEVWQQVHPASHPPYVGILSAPHYLTTTLHRMVDEARHPDPTPDPVQYHLLMLLFRLMLFDTLKLLSRPSSMVSRALATAEIVPVVQHRNTSIEQALSLMRNDYQRNDLTLTTVADVAGLSLFHFTRLFKQETGMTPGHYLRQQRLNHALHLLFDTPLSLDEVAYQSGLGSARRLSDLCQATFGQATAQLRKTSEQILVLSDLPEQEIVGNEQRNVV